LFGSVNKHANPDDDASKLFDGFHNFSDRAAGSQNIVNNQDAVTGIDGEATPKNSCLTFFFGEYSFYAQLFSYFESQYNAAGGWTGNYLDIVFLEMLSNEPTELLGVLWVLQDTELFPIDG
jgi:hypothetical protein